MTEGRIISVNGPIVKAEGLVDVAMMDLVHVGHMGLTGEIIRFDKEIGRAHV